MARPTKRGKIRLTKEEAEYLRSLAKSRTASIREVERAKIILLNIDGKTDKGIARELGIHRLTVKNCLDKCCSMGVESALKDLPRVGVPRKITDEEKMFIVNLACKKPLEFGYSYELWTYSLLLGHIHKEARERKLENLLYLSRSKLWTILNEAGIKPHKIRYYLEKRDPDFDEKMAQVLCVYKEVEIVNKKMESDRDFKIDKVTISYDEKPGIQAIGNKAPDLLAEPGKYTTLTRDYEYIRYGTLSLLAGIDLHNGNIIANVSKSHKSSDFIDFLKKVDNEYQEDIKIRLVLDNHSSHISKETRKYLETVPNRFEFVFTPKHGSWLNLIEAFFSKMTRGFLRGIRVSGIKELKKGIEQFIEEVNRMPVIFRWKYRMFDAMV